MEYRLRQMRGYEISTDKTEDLADELLDQFIKMWNSK
jgi:hypothetical protein